MISSYLYRLSVSSHCLCLLFSRHICLRFSLSLSFLFLSLSSLPASSPTSSHYVSSLFQCRARISISRVSISRLLQMNDFHLYFLLASSFAEIVYLLATTSIAGCMQLQLLKHDVGFTYTYSTDTLIIRTREFYLWLYFPSFLFVSRSHGRVPTVLKLILKSQPLCVESKVKNVVTY